MEISPAHEITPVDAGPGRLTTKWLITVAGELVGRIEYRHETYIANAEGHGLVARGVSRDEAVAAVLATVPAPTSPAKPVTEHERRARTAKAVALATVLADTSAIDDPRCVHDLSVPGWELAAAEATKRGLLGQDSRGRNRTVHVPNSPETVAAVERELRIMQVEQRVDIEQPTRDAGRPGDDLCPHGQAAPRSADGTHCTGCGRRLPEGVIRRATDSQGYRQHMRTIVPVPNSPEPTDDDLFAAFAQADRR